jgi:hypothetical protein
MINPSGSIFLLLHFWLVSAFDGVHGIAVDQLVKKMSEGITAGKAFQADHCSVDGKQRTGLLFNYQITANCFFPTGNSVKTIRLTS